MKKTTLILLTALTIIIGTTIPAYAVTPTYKPLSDNGYTGVPDIEVELSEEVKQGVDNAVQEALKNYTLTAPKIAIATKYSMFINKILYVKWNKVDGATGYDINVQKKDGSVETYQSKYNFILIVNVTNPLSVKVRAFDNDGHLSYWSIKEIK